MNHEVLLDGAGRPMMELPQGAHGFKSKLVVTQGDGLSMLMESENPAEARDLAQIGRELRAGGSKAQLNEQAGKTVLKTKGVRAMWEITPVGAKMIKRGHKSSGWEVDVKWGNSQVKRKV